MSNPNYIPLNMENINLCFKDTDFGKYIIVTSGTTIPKYSGTGYIKNELFKYINEDNLYFYFDGFIDYD